MDYSKKTKEELIKEIEILKLKEQNFSYILDGVNELFYRVVIDENNNKTIEYLSPQVENVFGLTNKEYVDNQEKLFEYFHPDETEQLKIEVEKNKKSTSPKTLTYRFYNKKLKKYVWVEEIIINIFSDKGIQTGVFGTAKDVTEKKEQQLKVIENEEKFNLLSFATNEVVIIHEQGIIQEVNNAVIKIFGYTPEELIGKSVLILAGDESKEMVKNNVIINYTKPYEAIGIKKNGEKIYGEILGKKLKWKGKEIRVTTVRDITEKKAFEEALKISEKSYKELFDSSPDLLYIQNKKGEFIDVNKTVLTKYGYKREDFIGKTPEIISSKEKNNNVDLGTILKKVWEGKTQKFEWWGVKKNKEEFLKEVILNKATYFNQEVIIANGRDITEKKIIEEHLKQNEERYRQLFTKNLAGVFITENETIIECNNAFAKIFGYNTRIELIAKKVVELYFSPIDREVYISKLRQKGSLSNYRLRHKDKNGNEVWVLTNVTLIETGTKTRLEGTLIDITDQVIKEKQLKQSEENYKNLIENSPYGIIIHIEGKIVFVNKKAADIVGIEDIRKHKIKDDILDYLLPEFVVQGLERREILIKGNEVPFIEVKIKSPITGKIIDAQTRSTSIEFQNQKATQVVFQDISAQKQLAKERLKSQIAEESNKLLKKEIDEKIKIEQELLQNQNYTKNLISSSLDVICASDNEGKIKEFNKAAEITFGYTKEEMENQNANVIYANLKDFNKISKQLNESGFFAGEVLNKRKNGDVFTSFLSASVLYGKNGETLGTMGVSRDITDIKLAELELIESEERYRDLFENASDLIQSINTNGEIVFVNNAWKNTLGYKDKDLKGKKIFDFLHLDGKDHCESFFKKLLLSKTNTPINTTIDLQHKNGDKIIVEGSVGCKFNSSGKIVSTRGIFRNVTEDHWNKIRQEVYNNISKIISEKTISEEIYESIRLELGKVMNTDVFVISFTVKNQAIVFPYSYDKDRGGRIFIQKREQGNGINEFFLKQKKSAILKQNDIIKLVEQEKIAIKGNVCKTFVGVPLKVDNNVVGVLSVQSDYNENEYNNKTLEILDFISGAVALTIQKKHDEQMLFEQTSKLKSIIESSSHLFWTYDKYAGLTSFNQNYSDAVYDLYGSRPQIISGEFNRVNEVSIQPFWDKKYDEAFKGKKVEFITERINKKGNRIIREVFLNPIFDENNMVALVSGIAHDITDKQIAEENLISSLKEKEVLLKEVHHRVKNNLQVISSILSLQSSYIEDQKIITVLRESQDRIKTMSIIHESLYQANDFSKINFSQYIVSLSKNLVHSYGILDSFVETVFEIDEVSLSLDLSIPCGLIINELVSNALKYAFKGKKKGKITISLLLKNEVVIVKVSDNGVGMPKDININETNTLGLQLVTTLVEQIDGELKIDINKGTTFTITFKQIQ